MLAAPRRHPAPDADDGPRTVDPGSIRTLFLDLVGRPPFRAERAEWLGRPRAELIDALLGGVSFWEHWLEEQLYYFLLIENFRPASPTLLALPSELAESRVGVRDALARIAFCPSFDRRNPGADTFVTVVMEQIVGLSVEHDRRELEIGKRVYDGHEGRFLGREGSTQADVVRIAIEDERCLEGFVAREHARFLHTEAGKRDVRAWTRHLEDEPFGYPDLVRGWMTSAAYDERLGRRESLGNRLFLRSAFVDLFDRLPDGDELRQLRTALDALGDSAPMRSAIVRILLDSGQADVPAREELKDRAGWVEAQFLRLLGRGPTERERTAFVAALSDPACRVETVLFAVVADPQYGTY